QVTNPPIDSLRESRVMSLRTRFGNPKNVLDESAAHAEITMLESPFLANGEFEELTRMFAGQATQVDCTFAAGGGADALAEALARIRAEAEDAVRSGHGHIILTDEGMSGDRIGVPMILATSAVHSWL